MQTTIENNKTDIYFSRVNNLPYSGYKDKRNIPLLVWIWKLAIRCTRKVGNSSGLIPASSQAPHSCSLPPFPVPNNGKGREQEEQKQEGLLKDSLVSEELRKNVVIEKQKLTTFHKQINQNSLQWLAAVSLLFFIADHEVICYEIFFYSNLILLFQVFLPSLYPAYARSTHYGEWGRGKESLDAAWAHLRSSQYIVVLSTMV